MTTPFWCLLALILLPYVLAGLGGYYRIRQFGALDNHHPRAQAAGLEGIGARVWAAQQNGWEAVAVFAPAVIVAHVAGADPGASAFAALVVTGARLLYTACYIADLAILRSLIFAVGLGGCVWLFVLTARAAA